MPQRFGPWDDALNREFLSSVKRIVHMHRDPEQDDQYEFAQDAIDAVGDLIDELEGPDWEETLGHPGETG